MSRMKRASNLLSGTTSDRSKIIGSTQIPRGRSVSFDKGDLSVSVHNKVQVEYDSGPKPRLKFKLPMLVSLAVRSHHRKGVE
jgi:hypothetical protein